MRPGKYLNIILTVNAIMLSALVWMQLTGDSRSLSFTSEARAQDPGSERGIPNAGAQRQRMIEELQGMRASMEAMRKQLDGGKMKVTVANIDELAAATKAEASKASK